MISRVHNWILSGYRDFLAILKKFIKNFNHKGLSEESIYNQILKTDRFLKIMNLFSFASFMRLFFINLSIIQKVCSSMYKGEMNIKTYVEITLHWTVFVFFFICKSIANLFIVPLKWSTFNKLLVRLHVSCWPVPQVNILN